MKSPFFSAVAVMAVVALGSLGFSQSDKAAAAKPQIGLQLYSLRDALKTDVPGTLDKVKALGIEEVELANVGGLMTPEGKKLLDARGLKPIGGHWPFERLDSEPEKVAEEAKALGCSYVACAWIPHSGAIFTEADARKAIAVFNKAGEACKAQGLRFCYHIHGYEFHPYKDGTLFDLLAEGMKPGVADFEMDVFWVVHPGQDPVALLKKYPDRFVLMHLKDKQKGTRHDLTGHAPNEQSVPLGTGMVDWPALLAEAKKAGVKHYFIEDEAPAVEDQLPVTIKFLKTQGF